MDPRKFLSGLLLILCISVSVPAGAADPGRYDVRISLGKTKVETVLGEITKQTGISFSYENSIGEEPMKALNVFFRNKTISEMLESLLGGMNISWSVHGQVVALSYNKPAAKADASVRSPGTFKVWGTVSDKTGFPLPGVTVLASALRLGTQSDASGKWEISLPEGQVELSFSCLGYKTLTRSVSSAGSLDVILEDDNQLLEEIVVVGYGTQKKANVTGAVTSIDYARNAEGRPILSTSSSLAGLAPGMSVLQGSGQPGSDGATIRIRGIGSFTSASCSPLVLVDGIEWSMDNVNPNDIESISVLKDAASTAIYGTRAANGVILVTTKSGAEAQPRISYSYKGIIQMPYNNLSLVSDYAEYMELFNEGCDNARTSHSFSQISIDTWKSAAADPYALNEYGVPNYVAYPNTDWFGEIFDNGYSQEHNVSISGGSRKSRYLISGGYLDNQGIMNRFNLDSSSQKANFRTNVEADVLDWFTVGTKILGQWQQYGCANISNGFNYLYMTTPGIYPGSENAWGRPANNEESPNANNVFAQMAGSTGSKQQWRLNGTVYAKIRPVKGVSIEGTFNYSPTLKENKTYSRENGFWDYVKDVRYSSSDLSKAVASNSMSRTSKMSTDLLVRYDGSFGEHTIGAIAGYSAIQYRTWGWGVTKKGATDWDLHDQSTFETIDSSSSSPLAGWGLRSYFGRVNYSLRDRYLFEANLRVDGSSKFGSATRYGVFPSFSAGWKMHEEEFMAPVRGWLNSLKIRASWGQTGNNQGIGDFAWQATYATGKVTIDGSNSTGLYIASMSNINLKWETTSTTDIGIDAAMLDSRLTAELDFYDKSTNDILFTPSVYMTMGFVSQVPSNLGSMWNRGVELALNWKDTIGKDFYYHAGVNFSYNRNRVTSFKGELVKEWRNGKYYNNLSDVSENWSSPGKLCEGHAIGEHYILQRYRGTGEGYTGGGVDPDAGPVDGMIRTETDMKWVKAMIESGYSFGGKTMTTPDQLWYGDFIYQDTNGDRNYGNEDDKEFNGHSSTPAVNLGLNLGVSYKGFDLSMVWAGAFGFHIYWASEYYNSSTVTWGYGIGRRVADDHYFYDPENPSDPRTNIDGTYPRLYKGASRNKEVSDFYEYRGDYLKLKNLQLGYTLPKSISDKASIKELRFYVSGENLLTLTSFPGMDPERGSSIGYPLMRQISLGAQITF